MKKKIIFLRSMKAVVGFSLISFIYLLDVQEGRSESNVNSSVAMIAATTLVETQNFTAQRQGLYTIVTLKVPHHVLSTSRANGGQSKHIQYLVNHQSMEARGDRDNYKKILGVTADSYHSLVAKELSIEPMKMSLMGTAANMNNMAVVHEEFRNLKVDVFVTAGVKGNALRAGDPATWMQGEKGNEFVANKGTINTIVIVNQPVTPGAMAKAAMVMTEAKSAALRELAISSKVSPHIATGTGTDQFIIATPITGEARPRISASGHLKLGELIGKAVHAATLEALRWQNGLERSAVSNVVHAMKRFGLDEKSLFIQLKKLMDEKSYLLLDKNRKAMLTESRTVASTYGYAAVLDRIQYGTISQVLAKEALKDQAASIAVSLSSRPDCWITFWNKIKLDDNNLTHAFNQALALGWKAKWEKKSIFKCNL